MTDRRDDQFPKKRVAAGALFFNAAGDILLVRPTYQEGWSIPGVIVGPTEIARLRLPAEELSQYRFVSGGEALGMLRPRLRKRLPACLRARELGRTVYLHDGEEV